MKIAVHDGMRVIQERDESDTPWVSYTRGTYNCYAADGNGSITYLVNSSQTVAASYRYDPYGNTISSSGSLASANVYRFSSKEFHANSGLYYYGFRWYSPNLQRWLNRDPIGELGGVNLYRFAGGDAANFVDPQGLWQIYSTVSGELTLLFGFHGSVNLVLWDSEDPRNLGLHAGWGPSFGLNAGVGTGVGFVSDTVDGASSCWDFNFGSSSVTGVQEFNTLYDPKGAEFQLGPGAGVSYGHTKTAPWFTVGDVIDAIKDWWRRITQG